MTTKFALPPIDWVPAIVLVGTFCAALVLVPLYGVFVGYSMAAWCWFGLFLALTGLSITGGYHRLWAHRTYDAHWSVRLLFMLFGAMAIQNSILVWCAGHRPHHRFVDEPTDRGTFYYGGADTVTCMAHAYGSELVASTRR